VPGAVATSRCFCKNHNTWIFQNCQNKQMFCNSDGI